MLKKKELEFYKTPSGQVMAINVTLTGKGEFRKSVSYKGSNGNWYSWTIEKEYGPSIWSESQETRKQLVKQMHDRYGSKDEYQALANQIIEDLQVSANEITAG